MASPLTDEFLVSLLHRIQQRLGGQVFLFGPDGDPFWAARTPLDRGELGALREALELLEATESRVPRPFVARDERGRFVVAALEKATSLYVVLFAEGPAPLAAEARVAAAREELAPYLDAIQQRVRPTARA